MAPFSLQSDNILTSLMSQVCSTLLIVLTTIRTRSTSFYVTQAVIVSVTALQSVPPTIWYRLVAGLNAQLRLVRRGHLRSTFRPVISWLQTHANPTLKSHGLHINLACFQPSASGYHQFGLVVCSIEDETVESTVERRDKALMPDKQPRYNTHPFSSFGSQWILVHFLNDRIFYTSMLC